MTTKFYRKILHTIFIASALMMSACATINTSEPVTSKADEMATSALEQAKLETSPALQTEPLPSNLVKTTEALKTAVEPIPDTAQAPNASITKINTKEPLVNIRTSPSVKSRVAGVLKRGQTIEVLDTKDSWVKITWNKGNSKKQGWLKRMFVEGYEL